MDFGKLQYQQCSAGFQNTVHLFQRGILVRHIPQTERHGNQIKIIVRERQFFRIGKRYGKNHTFVQKPVAPDGQHGRINIGQPNFALIADAFCPPSGQITRTACDIQYLVSFFQVCRIDGKVFPHTVQPCRHNIVHNVVVFCNRMEDFRHFAGFLIFIYRTESEMRFLFAHFLTTSLIPILSVGIPTL